MLSTTGRPEMEIEGETDLVIPDIDIKPVGILEENQSKRLLSSPYKGSAEPPPTKLRRTRKVSAYTIAS